MKPAPLPPRSTFPFPWILLIIIVAAVLRMIAPTHAPAGLQVDEASNVWNAWCLGQTGVDEHGEPWPIFTTAEFGSYRSPLFLYFIIPFQSMFGFNLWSARLASALAGVAAVYLIYRVGRRWFSRNVGLAAAALMAIDPWHLQLARWAHEASLCPLLVLLAVTLTTSTARRRNPWLGLIAGLITGAACYGYSAIRLFLPLYGLVAAAVIGPKTWREWLRLPKSTQTLANYLIGGLVTFAPLAYQHLTNPNINLRARDVLVWQPTDSLPTRVEKVLARYGPHFDPISLSFRSPSEPSQATPQGFGLFGWYIFPLGVVGAIMLIRRWRADVAARLLIAAVVVYPAGDLLSVHPGVNALRSSPGVWAVLLLAAVGADAVLRYLGVFRRNEPVAVKTSPIANVSTRPRFSLSPRSGVVVCATLALAITATTTLYLIRLFGQLDRSPAQFEVHNVNVLKVCDWLRPRWNQFDGVIWTETRFNYLYPVTAVGLEYQPQSWLHEPKDRFVSAGPNYLHADVVLRYGKQFFCYPPHEPAWAMEELHAEQPVRRVAIIARPEDTKGPALEGEKPQWVVNDPDGKPSLMVFVLETE